MARGDHPQRTPVYGALLIVAAMVVGTLVSAVGHPGPVVRVPVLVVCLVAAIVGLVLTLRDRTPPR